jgi:hypothetical protein
MNLRNEGTYGLGSAFIRIAANRSDQNSEYFKRIWDPGCLLIRFFPSRIPDPDPDPKVLDPDLTCILTYLYTCRMIPIGPGRALRGIARPDSSR